MAFVAGKRGVADEPKVCLEPETGESSDEPVGTRGKAPGP